MEEWPLSISEIEENEGRRRGERGKRRKEENNGIQFLYLNRNNVKILNCLYENANSCSAVFSLKM